VELRDLIVTPLLLIIVYLLAYRIRPLVTDAVTVRYFIPALTVRIFGALALGFIYQFYYNGGDTFNYHNYGSRHIWEAFLDSPATGVKLLFADGSSHLDVYKYSSKIVFFSDFSSYNVVRISAIFDLLTFSTYSSTAILFSIFSFVGMWYFFLTFYKIHPHLHRGLAFASFFIPSVFFWGSGLLKDTITLGCLGMATYFTYRIFIEQKASLMRLLLWFAALYGLYAIKIYVLLNFLPAVILWVFLSRLGKVRAVGLKLMLYPFVVVFALLFGGWAVMKASQDNPRYSLDKLAQTAKITAYDIRYHTGRDAGSGYTLGDLDGSMGSILRLAPAAINVSLFRPYMWEVKNPLMLLAALESLALIVLTLFVFARNGLAVFKQFGNPDVLFCLVFSLSFAFAVGVSTYNFGTLVRYKIPLLPFMSVGLLLLYDLSKRDKNVPALDLTE
jgi:hypothetical protein